MLLLLMPPFLEVSERRLGEEVRRSPPMVDLTYSLGVAAWREQLMCERRSQRSIGRILDPRSATPQQRERAPGLSTSARRARKRLSRTPLGTLL